MPISNMPKRSRLPGASRDRPASPPPDLDEKDDEELELESMLFGKKRKRVNVDTPIIDFFGKGKGKEVMPGIENEDDREMGRMADDELFMVDEPVRRSSSAPSESDKSEGASEGSSESGEDEEEDDDGSESDSESSSSSIPAPTLQPRPTTSANKGKQPLWHDPSDDRVTVSLADDKRLRKLARDQVNGVKVGSGEVKVGGKELEKKLRGQFEKMHPAPSWASTSARAKAAQTSNLPSSSLLNSTTPFLSLPSANTPLPQGNLDIARLRDANYQSKTTGEKEASGAGKGVISVDFHRRLGGVLSVVGGDRRLRMFTIDGHNNPSLLTIHIPSLPITTAHYHPSGTSLLLSGPRPYYYTYDLTTQRCLRSPASLFSNTKSTSSSTSPLDLSKTAFSPDGSILAVGSRRGVISLIAWASGGAGQQVATLNSGKPGGVKALMFMNGGKELWVLGEGSEVDVWDLGSRRVIGRWRDEGAFGGKMLVASKDEEYSAVGSTTGIVNLYSTSSISDSVGRSGEIGGDSGTFGVSTPKPLRDLMNLTTEVSTIAFNHDSQMMAIASDKKKDAFRVIHLPSATAFTNWPTSSTPLGTVTSADFSMGSEYLAVGNTRGKVLLYNVRHFGSST